MPVFTTKIQLDQKLAPARQNAQSIGLVPTMGALHKGHLSIVQKALAETDVVVVSIFVNPTQFNNQNDLKNYPRALGADVALLQELSGEIIVFAPSKEEIYNGRPTTKVFDFDGLDTAMEGKFRPGHFLGVATVVELLLSTVDPHKAYFGEKDFQQLLIIKKMVAKKRMPYQIVACPIAREANGLAMSSRNQRLRQTTRDQAGFIHKTLLAAKNEFGTKNAKEIIDWATDAFEDNGVFELEYFQIAEAETLGPITKKEYHKKYRAFVAVYADNVRLIDNIALN